MPGDIKGYSEAVERDARLKVKAQVMHDLSIIAAGIWNRHEVKSVDDVAEKAVATYQALKTTMEKYLTWTRDSP